MHISKAIDKFNETIERGGLKKNFEQRRTDTLGAVAKRSHVNIFALVVHDHDDIFVVRIYGPDCIPDTIQEYEYVRDLLVECDGKSDPTDYFWNHLAPHEHDLAWWNENVA